MLGAVDWTTDAAPVMRGALATKQPRGRVMRPLGCFAALAMTGWELAFISGPRRYSNRYGGDRFRRSRISLPVLKNGTSFSVTGTLSPVRGLRPVRA
jgi:hypothetical protein